MNQEDLLNAHKQLWLSLPEYAMEHTTITDIYTLKMKCVDEMFDASAIPERFGRTACFLCVYAKNKMHENDADYYHCEYCPGKYAHNARYTECLYGFYQLAMDTHYKWLEAYLIKSDDKDGAYEDFCFVCDIIANLSYIELPEFYDYNEDTEDFSVQAIFEKMKKEKGSL